MLTSSTSFPLQARLQHELDWATEELRAKAQQLQDERDANEVAVSRERDAARGAREATQRVLAELGAQQQKVRSCNCHRQYLLHHHTTASVLTSSTSLYSDTQRRSSSSKVR